MSNLRKKGMNQEFFNHEIDRMLEQNLNEDKAIFVSL